MFNEEAKAIPSRDEDGVNLKARELYAAGLAQDKTVYKASNKRKPLKRLTSALGGGKVTRSGV